MSRALVDQFKVKFEATTVQDTDSYDIYKIFEDLFLSKDERDNMLSEGIQSTDLNKIRSGAGDKKTTGVDDEEKLDGVYGTKYRINLDHPILTDHGVFYPQALPNDLVFELTLAPAVQVVRGSDASKLVYKLENIQLEYEVIRSKFLFLSKDERDNMLSEGIQSTDLNKIRSGAGDKKTTGVDDEEKLDGVYGTKYRINLDHPILTDHGVFYPQALPNDLVFELTLAPAVQVVRGSDASKLVYKLENIQLEYEVIRSKFLADEALSTYNSGKEFAYDLVMREKVVPITRGSDTRLNLRVNLQHRSLKGILLLFINSFVAGARDSEHYFNPDINKVKVTVNGVPNRVYNEGIGGTDMWKELTRYFKPSTNGGPNMTLAKYLTANKFGLWIDLRSMADTTLHGNGQRLVNTQDGVQLEIERTTSGSGTTNCHIFTVSDSQMNIMSRQLASVQY